MDILGGRSIYSRLTKLHRHSWSYRSIARKCFRICKNILKRRIHQSHNVWNKSLRWSISSKDKHDPQCTCSKMETCNLQCKILLNLFNRYFWIFLRTFFFFSVYCLFIQEIHKYIALSTLMGISNKPKIPDYWSTHPLYNSPQFASIMSRNRYQLISKFLHFADNRRWNPTDPNRDRLFKVRPQPHE